LADKKISEAQRLQAYAPAFVKYWLVPCLYVALLAVAYLRFGFLFQFTLGAAWLAVVPFLAYFGKSREFLRNTTFFVSLLLCYEALQGITGNLVQNGTLVYLGGIDRALVGFNLPMAVQTVFQSSWTSLVSTIFYGLHVFLVLIAVMLFWFFDRRVYRGYAYSMVVCSYLALFTFVLLPTAPPWFAGTARNLLPAGNGLLPGPIQALQQALLSIESDKFAAFPSLHAAYATLFAVFAWRLNRKVGVVAIAVAVGVYFSTLYLGQHYLIDLIGGAAYALGSVFLVDRFLSRHAALPRTGQKV
jgi:membrane-associated phospholipid phosphatase